MVSPAIGDHIFEKILSSPSAVMSAAFVNSNVIIRAKGGAIRRRLLKCFIANHYRQHLEKKTSFSPISERAKVAVVGGGPTDYLRS